MWKRFKFSLRFFLEDVRGGLSVEAALAFPMLVWTYGALYVYWDAFKAQNNNVKATFTIGDMLSRETAAIDQDYLNGLNKLFRYMTLTNHDTKLRVSVVSRKLEADGVTEYNNLEWTHSTNGLATPNNADDIKKLIPVLAVGDQVIIVETLMAYEPIFSIGLEAQIYGNSVATRPRFVPQVLWSD